MGGAETSHTGDGGPPYVVSCYFEPVDLAMLASTEGDHYWHRARRQLSPTRCPPRDPTSASWILDVVPARPRTFFNGRGHTVDYADVHPEALALARTVAERELGVFGAARLRYLQLDVCRDPVPDGYGCVLLLDVIEHLPSDVTALK